MKRTLLFLMAVLFAAIGNVQTTFAQKASLNAADGWTQITSLPDNPSQYFFAIYDHEQDLGMVFKNGDQQGNGNWTMWYTADVNPMDNEAALWMIGNNDEYQVIANFTKPQTMLQTEWNAAWFCHATDNGGGGTNWGHTKFTYLSDGYWTIQNGQYPDAGYVGPWSDVKQDNAEIAANKQGDAVGHFDIFAITRQQYWINRVNAGLTYPFDMTNAIANTDAILQPNQGWTETYTEPRSNGYTFQKQGNDGLSNKVAQVFFESWQGSGNLSDRQMEQTLANMPVGNYKLTVNTDATATGAFLYAGSNEIDLSQKVDGVASLDFKVSSDNQNINLGIKLVSHLSNWVKFDHFQLTYYRLPINMEAVELPSNGDMAAGQWYYIDVAEGNYSALATNLANIVYTTDGNAQADDNITDQFNASSNALSNTRYYVKSTTANNLVLDTPRATAAQMSTLAELIATAEAKTLGFDDAEYAPYNNVDAIITLADAKTIEQNNPSNYTESFVAEKITAMQNLTWTANNGEVNAIAYGDLSSYETVDGKDYPYGWTNLNNTGNNSRIMGGNEGSNNAGLAATSTGKAMLQKFNATYGETTGYTMPLKANTYYKVSFKYCGWNNTPTTNVVLNGPNGNVTVTPASFRPETSDGHSDASHWYTYTGIFTTGETAGDYTLSLNKVEGGQQQIAWGDMVLVRASAADLEYTAATGPMNADVAAAQTAAVNAFEADKTFANYETLMAAIEAANASVAEYQRIAARLALLAAQTGDIPQEAFDASTTYTNYTNGVYTSLDEVVPAFKADVAEYWTTNAPTANADLTAFIVNNSFEFGNADGWNYSTNGDVGVKSATNQIYQFTNYDGNYVFNTWTGGQELHYIYQEIENLPNGTYEVTAVWCGWGDREIVFAANQFTASETWEEATDVFKPGDLQEGANETVGFERTVQAVVVNHKLRVGGRSDQFFKCDNFRLKFLSADVTVTPAIPEGQMNAEVKAAMLTAKAAFEATPSIDNYNALNAAIDNANASIALYQQINDRLNLLTTESQRGGLNEAQVKGLSFYTKYSDGEVSGTADATTGTYTSLDEVIPEYKSSVAAYYAANAPAANEDVSAFIVNNAFEFGNNTEWSGGGVNNGNIEWYNGNYNVYQTINGLPAGTYKLQAQGYYRPGGNDNASTDQNAMLYGGTSTSPVVLIASDGKSAADADNGFTTANTNSGSEVFVPNSQADAQKAFASGAYNNEVTFVVNGESVNVGFKKDVLIGADWTCFDNFKLIYVGPEATVAPELVNAPMNADISAAQTNAYNTWDANKSVANYNALLEAIADAQASADKYVIIDQRIPKLQAQADDIDATVLRTKYTDGEYVEPDDVFDAYRTVIAEYYAANPPAANDDMSRFLINPGFEYGNTDGWNAPLGTDTGAKDANNPTYKFTNSEGNYVFNTWSNWDQFLWIVQQTEGLPQGTYEVTAVFAGDKNRTIEFTAEDIQPKGSEQKLSFQPVDEDITYDKTIGFEKTITVFVSDGKLKVGAHANVFFKCDNFRLKFISSDINDPDLTKPMNRFERQNYIDARADYDANPTQENLNELLERKLIVENSIRAYEAAKETFDHVLEMMSKTNVYTYDAYFTIDDMYRKYGPEEGYYHYETLEDDVAFDMWRMFFGNGWYRDPNNFEIPAVPFIASAWDCGHDGYAYAYTGPGEEGTDHGSDYYANTWSMEGKDDGTFMYLPYLEYWREGDNLLDGKTMTATVDGTPGAEYTVKMLVRVRTYPEYTEPYPDPNNPDIDPMTIAGYPKGMTIQIGDGEPVTPRWTKINNADSPYRGTNGDKLWICDLWNYAEEDLPKGHVDQDGKLRIKFILDENMNNGGTSNVAWLSFKYVYVNYDGEDLTQALADLQTEVDYANANYYAHLGFDPEEYAPYTNVDELIALKRAQQVHDASENYFLVKAAHDKLYEYNHGGENGEGTWTKNPYEMNGFYWTDYWNNNEPDKYTAEDVQHVEWYDYEDDCITPSGWNLIGRNDGFSTGIVKLGVNSDGEGLKSAESETALRAKYETDYGQETGYTLPLKAGVKYIMTFTYAYEGDNPSGCPFETRISLSAPRTGVDNVLTEPLTVTEIQPLLPSGGENQANWYMYRATFVPEYTADYVVTFDKDNVDPEPVLYGDLTLVRYYEGDADPETSDENVYVINGESRTYGETLEEPKFIGKNVRITRSFNPGAYNSLVLPFKLAECELKEALGENWNGKVYYYTGATPTDTEGGDFYTLNFEERETGIFANVPVLFFNDADAPVNNWAEKIFNKMVTKRVENELTIDTDVFDFIGTYETIKLPNGAWYINAANQFMKAMGKSSLSPTRGYFLPRDADGVQITQAKLVGFSIDNVPTGIIAIEDDGTFNVTSGNIYTIDGRLVRQNATSLEGLAPGTYIVDGKKYVIR